MSKRRWDISGSAVVVLLMVGGVRAGSVRLWDKAVVVDDLVRVRDICSVEGFDGGGGELLSSLVITKAPLPGDTMRVSSVTLRDAIAGDGRISMVDVLLKGAAHCLVSRPADVHSAGSGAGGLQAAVAGAGASEGPSTLRDKLTRMIHGQLARYDARVSIRFDQESQPILDLREPEYTFDIRNRSSSSVGTLSFDIAVGQDGRQVRRATVLARVEASRPTVVAARAINQAERIDREDLDIVEMALDPSGALGISDPDEIVGQRAKRHIPAGSKILAGGLEELPLVFRGELVTVYVNRPGIRAINSGYALEDGKYGDVVTVRMGKRRGEELEGVVKGKGVVEVGPLRGPAAVEASAGMVRVAGRLEE